MPVVRNPSGDERSSSSNSKKQQQHKKHPEKMSCNGCRVLRKGCSDACPLRPCLQWIDGAEAQGHATVFVAKFFGRAGLMGFIAAVPETQRQALFRSLLYEACGRTVNPVYGAVGLLWSGNWHVCQAAVDTVLRGGALKPPSAATMPCFGPMPNLPRLKPSSTTTTTTTTVDKNAVGAAIAPPVDENAAAAGTLVRLAADQSCSARPPPPLRHHHQQVKRERQDDDILAPVPRRPRRAAPPTEAGAAAAATAAEDIIDLDLTLSSIGGGGGAKPPAAAAPTVAAPPPLVSRSRSPHSCSNSSEGSVTSLDTNDCSRRPQVGDDGSSMDLLHSMECRHHTR